MRRQAPIVTYDEKKQQLAAQLAGRNGGAPLALAKDTSNLFRDREPALKRHLDVRHFNQVLRVDAAQGWIEAEGMTRYADLVDAALKHNVMPAVVPELKSITLGGAVAGVGIEASSFKYGLVHETVQEIEILLGDGRIVSAAPDNEHSELFYGFPNSYGTLGYALKVKALAIPVKPYVALQHVRHSDATAYFEDLAQHCAPDADFVDGTVFGPDEMYITIGRFCDDAPRVSDYTFEHIYYRSIRERREDWLTARDFIWRWDTDWFWCSKNLYVQTPLIRRLVGRNHLNSTTYTKVMRWNSKWGLMARLNRLRGLHTEAVIQDVDIPIDRAAEFFDFFCREIGILPLWICPIHARRDDVRFDLYPMDADKLYVNFGFWDVVTKREPFPTGFHNRKIERKVAELGGIKSLYSDSYYEPDEFWENYNKPAYDALKEKYDPGGALQGLYDKCVLRR
ncbi:MAG TPA: FAD-binding oxidoreductase [Burkholderiales bacterium]|nr:FAD-binding oxidoreductase [Burkholderiales bacterium]